jgi:DMSO/TMAO reductase YedYZ molybdopterin-dependent catalytic subunit
MTQPGILIGALVGALVTAPAVTVFYLGWKLAGLPFLPFDLFDWMARRLPGALLTIGIETMVKLIRVLNLGRTAAIAKTAEQLMAIAAFVIAGAVIGALLFAVLRARRTGSPMRLGILVGAAAGVAFVLVSGGVAGTATTGREFNTLWILFVSAVWGLIIGWAYRRLREPAGLVDPAGVALRPETAEPPAIERVDRRQFLIRLGSASAAITVAGAVVGTLTGGTRGRDAGTGRRWSDGGVLPNAGDRLRPAPGTRPEFTPLDEHYRIDINLVPPTVNEADWKLAIRGLVAEPINMTLADLRDNFPPMHQFVTLACISNEIAGDLISTTRWTGVSLRRLLPYLRLRPEATHLKIESVDGFCEIVSLDDIKADERIMLTYAWDGLPLRARHGFPLRVYLPDRYGMKQPKWITSITAIDKWEEGYWVARGWDREARMKAASVIDTVAVDPAASSGGQRVVAVGGIAHAGARGISKVEVSVDDGEWREAQLRAPISGTTWVIWRYDWPFQAGAHTFAVRCTDGQGQAQIVQPATPHPAGATGIHKKRARF